MKGSSAVTVAAGVFIGLVLIKDGTLPNMITDGARFLRTTVGGLRPLSNIA